MWYESQPLGDINEKRLRDAYEHILTAWIGFFEVSEPSIAEQHKRELGIQDRFLLRDEQLSNMCFEAFRDAHDIVYPDFWKLERWQRNETDGQEYL